MTTFNTLLSALLALSVAMLAACAVMALIPFWRDFVRGFTQAFVMLVLPALVVCLLIRWFA